MEIARGEISAADEDTDLDDAETDQRNQIARTNCSVSSDQTFFRDQCLDPDDDELWNILIETEIIREAQVPQNETYQKFQSALERILSSNPFEHPLLS